MRIKYAKRLQYIREQELVRLTTVDSLTGAYNRNVLYLEIQKWIYYVRIVLNRDETLESFINRADQLLYIAKKSGKNQIAHSYS